MYDSKKFSSEKFVQTKMYLELNIKAKVNKKKYMQSIPWSAIYLLMDIAKQKISPNIS